MDTGITLFRQILAKPFLHKKEVIEQKNEQHLISRYPSDWIICLVIGCVSLCFNLYRLGAPSLWFDEILSVERASQPLPTLVKIIFATQPNMALYYVVLHFWLDFSQRLGLLPTEWVVRLPSAIFAALASILLFLLSKRFLGRRVGLLAVILYMLNALQLMYAQETRSYSMQMLLLSIMWYALLAILTGARQQKRWWICYTLATIFAVYTHVFSELVLAAQICAFSSLLILPTPWRKQARRQLLWFGASLICAFIVLIPLLLTSLQGSKTGWLPKPKIEDVIHLFISLGGGSKAYAVLLGLFCLMSIIGVGAMMLRRRGYFVSWIRLFPQEINQSEASQVWLVTFFLLCWCMVPLVASYVISLGLTRLFSARYLVVIMPPIIILAALGISSLSWRIPRIALSLLFVVVAAFSVPLYYSSAQVEDWREMTSWLQNHAQPEDGILCYDDVQGCQLCLEYYLQAYPNGLTFPSDAPGYVDWVSYDLTNQIKDSTQLLDPEVMAAYGAQHSHILFVSARLSGTASLAKAQVAQQWLDSHYQFQQQLVTNTGSIRLYKTTLE